MNLFTEVQKISEAYMVERGIQINRRFTDQEIADARKDVRAAARVLDSDDPWFEVSRPDEEPRWVRGADLLADNSDDEVLCEWLMTARRGDTWVTGGAFAECRIRRVA